RTTTSSSRSTAPTRWRWLEFGGHFNYSLGYGGATDTPQGSGLFLHEIELGGVARFVIGNHNQDARFGMGIEVGGGIEIPSLTLRGVAKGTPAPYLAPGV